MPLTLVMILTMTVTENNLYPTVQYKMISVSPPVAFQRLIVTQSRHQVGPVNLKVKVNWWNVPQALYIIVMTLGMEVVIRWDSQLSSILQSVQVILDRWFY